MSGNHIALNCAVLFFFKFLVTQLTSVTDVHQPREGHAPRKLCLMLCVSLLTGASGKPVPCLFHR